MSVGQTYQSNLTMGEVSPELYGRLDIDQYYAAAKTVNNGIPIPQGGITKRRGFKKLLKLDIPSGEFVKMIPMEFSEADKYICLLRMDGSFNFYSVDGKFITTITPTARPINADYPDYDESGTRFIRGTDIKDVQVGSTLDPNEIVVTHPLYAPVSIRRTGQDEFSVARTIFWQYVPKPAKGIPGGDVKVNKAKTWTPNYDGRTYARLEYGRSGSYPAYPSNGTDTYKCGVQLNYNLVSTDTGWYNVISGTHGTVQVYLDGIAGNITKLRIKNVEVNIPITNTSGTFKFYSETQSSTKTSDSGQKLYRSYSHIICEMNSTQVYSFTDDSGYSSVQPTRAPFGLMNYVYIGASNSGSQDYFKGNLYNIVLSGYELTNAGIPSLILGVDRPTATTIPSTGLPKDVELVSSATNKWVEIATGESIPEPSYKDFTRILSPKDNFGYTKYITSPWEVQTLQFGGFDSDLSNRNLFTLCVDGSESEVEIPYGVRRISLDGSTQDGDFIGDDATELVDDIKEAMKVFKLTAVVTPEYREESKTVIINAGGYKSVSVVERTFQSIIIEMNNPLIAPKRFWIKSKSNYNTNVLVRPIGGDIEKIATADQENYKGEDVWSDSRGFPSTVVSHGGRTVLGGSYAKPLTLWFTQSGLPYHFSPDGLEEPLANDSLVMTLNTPKVGTIQGMISGRTLLVLTNNTIMSVTGENGLITPLSAWAKVEISHGSKFGNPLMMDSKNYYIHADTGVLNSTVYDYNSDAYSVTSESLFAPHLVRDVSEMAVIESLSQANATYLVLKDNEGNLSAYCSIAEQGITSWGKITTAGDIRSITGLGDNLFIIVRRGTGEGTYFLEVMNSTTPYSDNSDSISMSIPTDVFSGYSHLVNETVSVLADGYYTEVKVLTDGYVVLPFTANDVEIGLPIDFKIETLPPNVQVQGKPITVNETKRVSSVKVNFLDTLGTAIHYCGKEYPIMDREMGFSFEAPEPYSGPVTKRLLGWSKEGTVSIESNSPVPATVLSIEKTVRLKG